MPKRRQRWQSAKEIELVRIASAMAKKFFYAAECPFADERSAQTFKSWNPWGWTEESCRAQVLRHLKCSGKHKDNVPPGMDRDAEYEVMVEGMTLQEDFYDPTEHVGKKQRLDDGTPRPKSRGRDDTREIASGSRHLAEICSGQRDLRRHGDASASSGPITRQDLCEVSDALGRCVTSARHAQRLSAMAAKAFQDEATIFEEVKEFVDAKIRLVHDV